jgi:DHA1 family bicyclomycin/chloramphenicol resistance-like MFS transporter
MGNDEIALSIVMTAGVAIALLALLAAGGGEETEEH